MDYGSGSGSPWRRRSGRRRPSRRRRKECVCTSPSALSAMGEQSLIARGDLGCELGVTTSNTPPAPASPQMRAAPTLSVKSRTSRRAAAPTGTRGHHQTGPCLNRAHSPGRRHIVFSRRRSVHRIRILENASFFEVLDLAVLLGGQRAALDDCVDVVSGLEYRRVARVVLDRKRVDDLGGIE